MVDGAEHVIAPPLPLLPELEPLELELELLLPLQLQTPLFPPHGSVEVQAPVLVEFSAQK